MRKTLMCCLVLALAASGWAASQSPASVRAHFYPIEHVMRCRVQLPENYDPQKTYPVLIVLHGRGGSARDFDHLWEKRRETDLILVAPEAPYMLPFEQRRNIPGYSWDIPVMDRRIWEMADPRIVDAIVRTVAEIRENYRVGAVTLLGFSQGAAYACMAAVRHPGLFAGAALVAGIFPGEFLAPEDLDKAKAAGLRFLVAHARNDKQIPFKKGEETRRELEKRGFNTGFLPYLEGHSVPQDLFDKIIRWAVGGSGGETAETAR